MRHGPMLNSSYQLFCMGTKQMCAACQQGACPNLRITCTSTCSCWHQGHNKSITYRKDNKAVKTINFTCSRADQNALSHIKL